MSDNEWTLDKRIEYIREYGPTASVLVPSIKAGTQPRSVSARVLRAVLEVLTYWDTQAGRPDVFRSCAGLKHDLGISERQARSALAALVILGWLRPVLPPGPQSASLVHGNQGGRKHATEWRIMYPKPGPAVRVSPPRVVKNPDSLSANPDRGSALAVPPSPITPPVNPDILAVNPDNLSINPDSMSAHPIHILNVSGTGGGYPPPPPGEEGIPPVGGYAAPVLSDGLAGRLSPADLRGVLEARGAVVTADNLPLWNDLMVGIGVQTSQEASKALSDLIHAAHDAGVAGALYRPHPLSKVSPFTDAARRLLLQTRISARKPAA